MKKDLNSYLLTKRELVVMKIVWERGSATVKDVCDALSRREATAYTTVLTLMQILERKGVLARKLVGRTHHYSPVISRRQAARNHVNDLLARYFDGNSDRLIETVLESEFQPRRLFEETGSRELFPEV